MEKKWKNEFESYWSRTHSRGVLGRSDAGRSPDLTDDDVSQVARGEGRLGRGWTATDSKKFDRSAAAAPSMARVSFRVVHRASESVRMSVWGWWSVRARFRGVAWRGERRKRDASHQQHFFFSCADGSVGATVIVCTLLDEISSPPSSPRICFCDTIR